MSAASLTFDVLKTAVAGSAAAFRLTLRLEAVSPKVFPPTYESGTYAEEKRRIPGHTEAVPCVLLDSVASQANRMEMALQDAVDGGVVTLPVVAVDFSKVNNPGVPKITSLQAPHRIVDAILRDSMTADKKKFRESDIGKELELLANAYATPLLKYAPHCLVFGIWDSTGPKGGLGVKFARALVSEIIGVNVVKGVKTSSRIDPLNISAHIKIYRNKHDPEDWTPLIEEAEVDGKAKTPVLFSNRNQPDKKKIGKPAAVLHGNIKPTISDGGFTIEYAEQCTVLSLPALRRLRFPAESGKKSSPESDNAARTYLAALGLLGATLAVASGCDLRSSASSSLGFGVKSL